MAKTIEVTESQIAEIVAEYKQARKSLEKAMKNGGHHADTYRTAALAIQRCMIILGIDEEYGC